MKQKESRFNKTIENRKNRAILFSCRVVEEAGRERFRYAGGLRILGNLGLMCANQALVVPGSNKERGGEFPCS